MTINISQSYSKELMLWLGGIFLVFPTLFTALRLTGKRLGPKRFSNDDYLAVIAWVFNVACCVCLLVAAIDGRLGQHQRVDENDQPILDDPAFLVYEKTKWAVNMLSVLGLGAVKLSILGFYLQLFSVRAFKIQAYVVIAFVSIWTISFFFSNLFTCSPPTWLVEPFYGKKCINSINMWMASTISDVVLDFVILLLPIPRVWSLQMRRSQKFFVVGIFLLGGCICGISIVRLLVWFQIAQQFSTHYNDQTYFTSPVFFWVVIELGLACVCAALPTMRPIWLTLRAKAGRSDYYSSRGSSHRPRTFEMARYAHGTDSSSRTIVAEPSVDSKHASKLQGRANLGDTHYDVGYDEERGPGERVFHDSFSSQTDTRPLRTPRT